MVLQARLGPQAGGGVAEAGQAEGLLPEAAVVGLEAGVAGHAHRGAVAVAPLALVAARPRQAGAAEAAARGLVTAWPLGAPEVAVTGWGGRKDGQGSALQARVCRGATARAAGLTQQPLRAGAAPSFAPPAHAHSDPHPLWRGGHACSPAITGASTRGRVPLPRRGSRGPETGSNPAGGNRAGNRLGSACSCHHLPN